jgi:hypothetical protein
MKSLMETRDEQIQELERLLSVSQSQLVIMKKRYMAALEAAQNAQPGTIKNIQKETVTIGIQVDEIRGMEERIYKLAVALKEEKNRNKRIKCLISENEFIQASIPPIPNGPSRTRTRGTCTRNKSMMVTETIPLAYVHRKKSRLSGDHFSVINYQPPMLASRPPIDTCLRADSPVSMISPIHHAPRLPITDIHPRSIPLIRHGVVGLNHDWSSMESSFDIYEDQSRVMDRAQVETDRGPRRGGFGRDVTNNQRSTKPTEYKISSPDITAARLAPQPPPFIPILKLPNQTSSTMSSSTNQSRRADAEVGTPTSSEDAIKRAVAAAIEKRKNLASMTSSRSSMSSFISDIVKPRFGCFLA